MTNNYEEWLAEPVDFAALTPPNAEYAQIVRDAMVRYYEQMWMQRGGRPFLDAEQEPAESQHFM